MARSVNTIIQDLADKVAELSDAETDRRSLSEREEKRAAAHILAAREAADEAARASHIRKRLGKLIK